MYSYQATSIMNKMDSDNLDLLSKLISLLETTKKNTKDKDNREVLSDLITALQNTKNYTESNIQITIEHLKNYKPKTIDKNTLQISYLSSYLFYLDYSLTKNFNSLWLSHTLLQHCLLNQYEADPDLFPSFPEKLKASYKEALKSAPSPLALANRPLLKKSGASFSGGLFNNQIEQHHSGYSDVTNSKHSLNELPSSLSHLPNDVLVLIFTYLELQDVIMLSKTNKKMNELIDDHQLLWANIEKKFIKEDPEYIAHCINRHQQKAFSTCPSRMRIIDFYAFKKMLPFNLEETLENKISDESSDTIGGAINCVFALIILITSLALASYYCYRSTRDNPGDTFQAVATFFAAGLMGSAATSCGLVMLLCLGMGIWKLCRTGIEATVNYRNRSNMRPFLIDEVTESLLTNKASNDQEDVEQGFAARRIKI